MIEGSRTLQDGFSLRVKGVKLKVKFNCRLFLQYEIGQHKGRTKEVQVQSKKTSYSLEEHINWPAAPNFKQMIITIKLLSSKGLSFTVGSLLLSRNGMPKNSEVFEMKANQTQDIEVICIFECSKSSSNTKTIESPHREIEENQQSSSKCRSERLELQLDQLREDYLELKEKISCLQSIDTKVDRRLKYPQQQKYLIRDERLSELQKELERNHSLYEKQRQISGMFERTLRQKSNECDQLRKTNKELTQKFQQLQQRNCLLQQEKVKAMMEQLKNEKQKCALGDYINHSFKQLYTFIDSIFRKRINNISSLAKSIQISKQHTQSKHLTTPNSPIKKLFHSTDFRKAQQQFQNCIAQDVSISGQFSVSDRETSHQQTFFRSLPRDSSNYLQQCIQTIKAEYLRIQKTVNSHVNKLFSQIMELSSTNKAYRKKMKDDKQQFQNNQESLIDYLEQLEDGLETQLEVAKDKQNALAFSSEIIQSLRTMIQQKQERIRELEESCQKLEKEKEQARAQLHENNYHYSIKQEQYLKRIYQLENGFEMPQYTNQSPPKLLNIVKRKPTIVSENEGQSAHQLCLYDEFYEEEVIYDAGNGRKEDQNSLRHTMLKQKRLQLVSRLREQIERTSEIKSMDEEDFGRQIEDNGIEEQFLKVLV